MQRQLEAQEVIVTPEMDHDCPFWPLVWKHANECRDARRALEAEYRRLRKLEKVVNAALAAAIVFGVAVLMGLVG